PRPRRPRHPFPTRRSSDLVEVSKTVVHPGQRVLLLDDVLATGGTAGAAAALLEEAGLKVTGMAFLMELGTLGGRQVLADRDPYSDRKSTRLNSSHVSISYA